MDNYAANKVGSLSMCYFSHFTMWVTCILIMGYTSCSVGYIFVHLSLLREQLLCAAYKEVTMCLLNLIPVAMATTLSKPCKSITRPQRGTQWGLSTITHGVKGVGQHISLANAREICLPNTQNTMRYPTHNRNVKSTNLV